MTIQAYYFVCKFFFPCVSLQENGCFFICKYVSCYVITHDAITIDIVTLFHINLYRYSVRLSRASSLFCSTNLTANKDSYTLFFSDATHEDSYFKGRSTYDPTSNSALEPKISKLGWELPRIVSQLSMLVPSDVLSVILRCGQRCIW